MLNDTHAYTHNQNYSIGRKDKWGLSRSWITGKQFVVETISLLAVAFLLSRAAVFGELLPFGTAFLLLRRDIEKP